MRFSDKLRSKEQVDLAEQVALFAGYMSEHHSDAKHGLYVLTGGLYDNDAATFARKFLYNEYKRDSSTGKPLSVTPVTDYDACGSLVFYVRGDDKYQTQRRVHYGVNEINEALEKLGYAERLTVRSFSSTPKEAFPEQIEREDMERLRRNEEDLNKRVILLNIAPLLKHPEVLAELNRTLYGERDNVEVKEADKKRAAQEEENAEQEKFDRRELLKKGVRGLVKGAGVAAGLTALVDGGRRVVGELNVEKEKQFKPDIALGAFEMAISPVLAGFAYAASEIALERDSRESRTIENKPVWAMNNDAWELFIANLKTQLPSPTRGEERTVQ